MEFEVGEHVEIMCRDGKTFRGVILDFTDLYFVLSPGLGFPYDDVLSMTAV